MSEATEHDLNVISEYLPDDHPQDLSRSECPLCALNRIAEWLEPFYGDSAPDHQTHKEGT